MLVRQRQAAGRILPHGPVDLLRQIALFAAAYYVYRLTRGIADNPGVATTAFNHARDVINIERTLNVFIEPSVQTFVSGERWLADIASWMYINAQTSITLGALAWIYLRRNPSFYFVRNMFLVAFGIALIGYTVFPTAPPRFLPEWGFIDTVAQFTGVPQDSVTVDALFNPYAAVPSMHAGFAIMIGWPLARLVKPRVAQGLLGELPPHRHLRDRRHRQPLPRRRLPRRLHRRPRRARRTLARARPAGRLVLQSGGQAGRASLMTTPLISPERRANYRNRLIESRLTPNAISLTGLVLCVVAAVLVWQEMFIPGGIAFIVGSVCDTLDGRYSRMSGKGTPFGAFLDSTLDRIEEGLVLAAVAVTFVDDDDKLAIAAVVIAVLASLLVSYTRARAEALGVECKVGIANRGVRVAILAIGLLFADLGVLAPAVYVLAALGTVTVLQRIFHVRRQLLAGV